MSRVDELRIWLHQRSNDSEFDDDESEFDATEIKVLAAWPLLDRLTNLNLCGPVSWEAEPLIAELLAPRVFVDTSY